MYNKNMKMRLFWGFAIGALFCICGCANLSESADRYRESVQEIGEGRVYFAVIHLQSIVKDDPSSPYAPAAAFALGEYYYDQADYFDSLKTLSEYIRNYPKHKGVVFAKLIIYKIIMEVKNDTVSLSVQEDE